MKTTPCNGSITYSFNNAPRCNARTKRNNGIPCRSPAVKGKARCRMHGGAKGSGARYGNQNAIKHGDSTREAKAQRKEIKAALDEAKHFLEFFKK